MTSGDAQARRPPDARPRLHRRARRCHLARRVPLPGRLPRPPRPRPPRTPRRRGPARPVGRAPALPDSRAEHRRGLHRARPRVTDVLDDLPHADLAPEVVAEAEQVLVGHCASFTPPEVRRLGRHLLDVLDPDTADAHDAARLAACLAAQEREALRRTKLRLVRTADGTRRLTGEIPELTASLLEAALRDLANPRRDHLDREATSEPADDGQRLTDSQWLGQAFCTLVEHLPTDGLPVHGGSPVTVVVTVDHHRLARDVDETGIAGVGTLDTGTAISPGELRRLACTHGVLPAVLGGPSEVLDLGRTHRFHTRAWRIAMRADHPECQTPGLHHPRRLVRGPPPPEMGRRRQDRPGRRRPPLPAPPPPSP